MRIAYVSRSAVPRAGGIEAHMDRVARGLAGRGHAVTVWAARVDETPFSRVNTTLAAQRFASFERGGVTTRPLPVSAAGRALMAPLALATLPGADRLGYDRFRAATLPLVKAALAPGLIAAFRDADVVHAWGGEPLMHAALQAARALGKPFVVTPFAHPGHWGDDELNQRLYRAADAAVALLAGEAAVYERFGVVDVRVIPVGAPDFPEDVRHVEKPAGTLVLALGVKRRYKYKALLDAIPFVAPQNVHFAFVGPETPESEADFAGASDSRIIRVAKVDEPEKWGWLRAADVLCLPSVSEILPVSILEAWRMGTPVVVAEGRFTRDLVANGEDGIVCGGSAAEIATAISQALADPGRLQRMGSAGAAKVAARYDSSVVVEAHESLYGSLA